MAPVTNETCDGCDETIRCFHLWDSERQVPGHESSDTGQPHE